MDRVPGEIQDLQVHQPGKQGDVGDVVPPEEEVAQRDKLSERPYRADQVTLEV